MRSVFFSLAFFVSVPVSATHPYFSEIMANTADDVTLEYFAIANPVCEPFLLDGYSVVDASGKAFSLPSSVVLDPLGSFVFRRPESKIALNNENETLSLFDVSWSLVDSVAYETSAKGVPIVRNPFSEHSCPVPEASDLLSEDSGATDSDSVPSDDSGQDGSVWPIADVEDADAEGQNGPSQKETVTETVPPSFSGADSVPDDPNTTQTGAGAPSSMTGGLVITDTGQTHSWSTVSGIADSGSTASGALGVSGATGQSPFAPSAISALAPTAASFSTPVSKASSASSVSMSRAVAESLTLLDSNGDTAFDAVEIRYSEPVVWNPDPNEFLLYSKTWGLYERKVVTSSWYFSTATVVGTTLRLTFSWTTLPKTSFRVDASTSSEFRIKTASDMVSLKTVSSWLPAMPLALTTSFSGYSPERVTFVPAFPEAEGAADGSGSSDGWSDDDAPGVAGLPKSESEVSDSEEAGNSASQVFPDPDAVSNGGAIVPSESANNSNAQSATVKTANVPKGVFVVPSSWIDLLPDGKYRQVCFSKTCSPSFKVEWLPSKSKGYWQFSDGRRRYGNSTSTLGKKVPAEYRLSYVLELPEWTAKIPVELSVLTEAQAETLFAQARTVNKSVAASAIGEHSDSDVLGVLDPAPVFEKSVVPKVSKPVSVPQESSDRPSRRAVSVAVASAFVGLAACAGYLAYRRRSWLPEESP